MIKPNWLFAIQLGKNLKKTAAARGHEHSAISGSRGSTLGSYDEAAINTVRRRASSAPDRTTERLR